MLLCVFMVWPTKLLQILWIMCKLNLLLENLWRLQEILFLEISGLIFLIWKLYHLILMHFCSQISMPRVKSFCFSKIVFFLKNMVSLCLIRSVHFVFRPIKIFKLWERESLSVSTDRGWFSTNQNLWIKFSKKTDLDIFKDTFQIVFFFSLSPRWL